MIYFLVAIAIVLVRAYMAGSDTNQFIGNGYGRKDEVNGDKVFVYVMATAAVAIFWPVALPIYLAVKLGQKFSKKG